MSLDPVNLTKFGSLVKVLAFKNTTTPVQSNDKKEKKVDTDSFVLHKDNKKIIKEEDIKSLVQILTTKEPATQDERDTLIQKKYDALEDFIETTDFLFFKNLGLQEKKTLFKAITSPEMKDTALTGIKLAALIRLTDVPPNRDAETMKSYALFKQDVIKVLLETLNSEDQDEQQVAVSQLRSFLDTPKNSDDTSAFNMIPDNVEIVLKGLKSTLKQLDSLTTPTDKQIITKKQITEMLSMLKQPSKDD